MEPLLIEAFFKTVCFVACFGAAIYVFTEAIFSQHSKPAEVETPAPEPEPPAEPERHGEVKCEGCGKDDPTRMLVVNDNCKHEICEKCVTLPPKKILLEKLQLCADQVYRVQLWNIECKVCSKIGFLSPPKLPINRLSPTVTKLPGIFRSASSMVEVVVGPRTSKLGSFYAPECILTGRSKLFARRFEGNTNAAREKKLKLPDHDPNIFGYVLEFMYSGQITDESFGDDLKPTMYDFFDIWALANFLEMNELCNYCAWSTLMRYDAIGTKQIEFDTLRKKYSAKDASNLMKKLIVDLQVCTKQGLGTAWSAAWPAEMSRDAGNTLRERIQKVPSVNPVDSVENYYIRAPASSPPGPPQPPPPPATAT